MGKSITATLMALMLNRGVYSMNDPAPIPEWQAEGDPRKDIRIIDLLSMSSGLRMNSPFDPEFDEKKVLVHY